MNETRPLAINETVVEGFEASWLRGEPEPIDRLNLDRSDPRYRGTLEELVHLELEFSWKPETEIASKSVKASDETIPACTRVEEYLGRFPELKDSVVVLRLLRQEYLVRCRFGDRPTKQEFRERFPDIVRTGDEIVSKDALRSEERLLSDENFQPGKRIGRYALIDEEGRGGFGRVWQVEDPKLGRRIALKQLSGRVAPVEALRRRFIAEAKISACLEHPGVVPVYDLDQLDEKHPYYTMKLVKGQTLAEAITRFHKAAHVSTTTSRSMEYQKLLGVFVSVCRTMEYAHAHNVIHRDLKPQNIILGDYGETIVLDWGLAKVLCSDAESSHFAPAQAIVSPPESELTQPGSIQGTPTNMSPEQAEARSDLISPRSDIYSLGTILYHLLTGELPFIGHMSEVLQKVREGRFSPPRSVKGNVPKALEAVCLKAMATQPENRYGRVSELREDIERYLADEPTSVLNESPGTRILRWCRHHKSVVTGAFVLLISAVVALSISTLVVNYERIAKQQALDSANREQRQRLETKVDSLLSATPKSVPILLEELWREERLVVPLLRELRQKDSLSDQEKLRIDMALVRSDPSLRKPIQERLLESNVWEVVAIRQALAPYREEAAADLWAIAERERQKQQEREEEAASGGIQNVPWNENFARNSLEKKEPEKKEDVRLRVACALATLDPTNSRWEDMRSHVAPFLVSGNPAIITDWFEAFRPVRNVLIPPLMDELRAEFGGQRKLLLVTVVAEYAEDDVAALVQLLEDSNPERFNQVFAKLRPHRSAAISLLRQRVNYESKPSSNDIPDTRWGAPPSSVVRQIEDAQGIVGDGFALAQTLSVDDLVKIAEALRPCGYRPIRFRPYGEAESLRTGAIWARDGREWRIVEGLTATEMEKVHQEMEEQGYGAEDLAGYVDEESGQRSNRFCGLWAERPGPEYGTMIVVGAKLKPSPQLAWDPRYCQRIQEFRGVDGELRYCAVYWKSKEALGIGSGGGGLLPPSFIPGADDESGSRVIGGPFPGYRNMAFRNLRDPGRTLVDVSTVHAPLVDRVFDVRDFYANDLSTIRSSNVVNGFGEGLRAFFDGDAKRAVEELTRVSEAAPACRSAHGFLAIAHAARGEPAEAELALDRLGRTLRGSLTTRDGRPSPVSPLDEEAFYRAMALIHSGNVHGGVTLCYDRLRGSWWNADAWFLTACVFATAASRSDELRYRRTALANLARAAQFSDDDALGRKLSHPLLDPVRDGFSRWTGESSMKQRYAAVLTPFLGKTFECEKLHGLSPEEHLRQCGPLVADGFHPKALALTIVSTGEASATSVWHRPTRHSSEQVGDTSRKTNAALALIGMGDADVLSHLLGHAEPNERASLVRRLASTDVDPAMLVDLARAETKPEILHLLLLAIGAFDGMTAPQKERLIPQLLKEYTEHTHSGVHSSAEWLLRRWGHEEEIRQIDQDLQGTPPRDGRQWYANAHKHTLAIIRGPIEFWMGSRHVGNWTADELLHRRRIPRTYAIATKETTVAQFKRFEEDFSYRKQYSPGVHTPIVDVTWYDAARYCRWLSEQEGIPEEEMCFPPLDEIRPGMELPTDCLSRIGYRLPTEAEWEFACRAGSHAPYFFGDDIQLQVHYAWAADNAEGRSHPVGTRMPNWFGLFDTHGNVGEFSMNAHVAYGSESQGNPVEDSPMLGVGHQVIAIGGQLLGAGQCVVRGGSFQSASSVLRSARRFRVNCSDRYRDMGFRIARTLPESAP